MKLSKEDRALVRQLMRERVGIKYELSIAAIDRREILEVLRYKKNHERITPELMALELRISDLQEAYGRVSSAEVARKFNCAPNTITSLSTANYR